MGMFDKRTSLTKSDYANRDFWLLSGSYVGVTESTKFGKNHQAAVTVADTLDGDGEEFVVYGVLAEQISRMDEGDLPAHVRIGKDGRANVFEPVNG